MHTCHFPALSEGVHALPPEEAAHVVRVLRMREGEKVRMIDGKGGVALGVLMSVDKRGASVEVSEVQREAIRPSGLTLVVSPTKHTDRFEWLLEKATELGVDAVMPVWSSRSERRIDKHERWSKVVIAATKQCQRVWMPMLHQACALSKLFEMHPTLSSTSGAVAHCMEDVQSVPTRESWIEWQMDKPCAWLAIGPEGDFSEEEVQFLHEHGATPVHLGELRLRTETAGIAAAAQFMQGSGRQ